MSERGPDTELVITRIVKAPRGLVWKAFTEAEHIAKWWGPKGFTTRVEEHDFRPGGKTHYVMTGPDGTEYPVEGVFREIVPQSYYVTSDEFAEDYAPPEDIDLPTGTILTVSFEDVAEGTKITLHLSHETIKQKKTHEEMGVVGGWNSSLDDLEAYLEGMS